jgi:hypothetical protein
MMFTTPAGRSACCRISAKTSADSGRGLRGLDDDGVTRGERRGNLPREHEQREVPRDHLCGDAERTGVRPEAGIVELVRPACVVEEPRCHEWHVDITALLDGFAVVQTLRDGEFASTLLDEPCDAKQVLAPVGAREAAPGAIVGFSGCGDRSIHILRIRIRNLGDRRFGRG